MTITTEDLTRMADGRHVFGHKDGLALAAELIAARAKIEAAEKLEVAARKYRRFVMDHNMTNEVVPLDTFASRELSEALAAWESLK